MQSGVVIVGAGAAGIGAGLELEARGVPFVILEAADRAGGRAFTDRTSLPEPWDQGCHWFHCADVNPLLRWADRLGAAYERRDRIDTLMVWQAGRWRDGAAVAEAGAAIDAAFGAVYEAGRAGDDGAMARLLPETGDWARLVRHIARLMSSADPEDVSARGYSDYADTQVNYAVVSGYGALVERMAARLPVRLGCPVTRIVQRAGGVRVSTAEGTVAAQAAVVTVSTNVLASGVIAIESSEARAVMDLVADVPCGAYEKVAVALRRLPLDVGETQFCWIEPGDGRRALNLQFAPTRAPMVIAHMGGSDAREMAAAGPAAAVAEVTDRLAEAFGSDIRAEILGAAVTGWQANPFVRGGYSYTRPGQAARRHAMIAAETGDIVFAGEAFSPDWYATAHGAYQSGRMAAARLAERLGR